ncbi:unnamed protein product [Closterium sp. NIES-64]|nr:unnamed protein product [Closterium sp. NIES-64]
MLSAAGSSLLLLRLPLVPREIGLGNWQGGPLPAWPALLCSARSSSPASPSRASPSAPRGSCHRFRLLRLGDRRCRLLVCQWSVLSVGQWISLALLAATAPRRAILLPVCFLLHAPAASVPVASPASADQIRRRFEDQWRELAPRAGRSLSPQEPLRAGFVLRSGAEAVAHQERSPRRRSSAAHDDKRQSRPMIVMVRPVRHCHLVAWRREADPVTAVRIVIVRPLTVHLASGRLPARRLGVGPQLRVRPLLQSANGSTPLVAGTVFLAASVSRAHLARSRLAALPAGMGFVGAGGGPPWAQFAPPRPLPAPRDLAVSSHRARASALLPPMKEVPTATLARLWSLAASLQSLERILQEPGADCHAAASALFALVTPLQVAPSPGATSASQLADSALALRTLVAGRGTPVDVVGATVSVVRQLWLNTSGMLAAVEADRM